MAADTRIELVRSGGLAGISMGADVRVGDLPSEQAAAVDAALAEVDLDALAARRAAPTGPDRYQYDVVVTDGGRRRSVRLGESEVPAELRPLLDALVPMARPRP
jgi:hypothetical protein